MRKEDVENNYGNMKVTRNSRGLGKMTGNTHIHIHFRKKRDGALIMKKGPLGQTYVKNNCTPNLFLSHQSCHFRGSVLLFSD